MPWLINGNICFYNFYFVFLNSFSLSLVGAEMAQQVLASRHDLCLCKVSRVLFLNFKFILMHFPHGKGLKSWFLLYTAFEALAVGGGGNAPLSNRGHTMLKITKWVVFYVLL